LLRDENIDLLNCPFRVIEKSTAMFCMWFTNSCLFFFFL